MDQRCRLTSIDYRSLAIASRLPSRFLRATVKLRYRQANGDSGLSLPQYQSIRAQEAGPRNNGPKASMTLVRENGQHNPCGEKATRSNRPTGRLLPVGRQFIRVKVLDDRMGHLVAETSISRHSRSALSLLLE